MFFLLPILNRGLNNKPSSSVDDAETSKGKVSYLRIELLGSDVLCAVNFKVKLNNTIIDGIKSFIVYDLCATSALVEKLKYT